MPDIVRRGVLDMQVCVPELWTDDEIVAFAERENPCGTSSGWHIRTEPKLLAGCPVRNPCAEIGENVHVMLDA